MSALGSKPDAGDDLAQHVSQITHQLSTHTYTLTAGTEHELENTSFYDGDNEDEEEVVKKHPQLFRLIDAIYSPFMVYTRDKHRVTILASNQDFYCAGTPKFILYRVILT